MATASFRPGDWITSSSTSNTTITGTSGTSSYLGFGGQQAVTPEQARYARYWTSEYMVSQDRYVKKLNKEVVHQYLAHMGMNDDPEYGTIRKHPHVFDSVFGPGSWAEYTRQPQPPPKPKPVVKKKAVEKMRARPPGHERIRVQEGGSLLDALQSSFDNWIGKNTITFWTPS